MGNLLYDFDVRVPLASVDCAVKRMRDTVYTWREGLPQHSKFKELQDFRQECMQIAGVEDPKRAGGECLEVDDAGKALFISALRNEVTRMNGVMGFLLFAMTTKCFDEKQITIPVTWRTSSSMNARSGKALYRVTEYRVSEAETAFAMSWSPNGDGVFEKWTAE